MKKLLFAIAGAASFAVLAADPAVGDNIDVLGFENFDLTQTATVSGQVIDRTDAGVLGLSKWIATGDDASLVKTYGGDNAAAPNITEPAPFAGAAENTKYLALDTNGSELQRYFTTDTTNGTPTEITSDTYIDTLVQFTPSESEPSSSDLDGAKLAIWLGVVNNETNLYVRAGQFADTTWTRTAYNYKLTGVDILPGTWYRLTVQAIPDITGSAGEEQPGFKIRIDGTVLASDVGSLATEVIDDIKDYIEEDEVLSDLENNRVFASLDGVAELSCVGFKGTGALDDFVVTTEAPAFAPPGGNDYKVAIDGSDVVITPQAGDLAALQAAIVAGGGSLDVTDVAAVNAALAAEIGSTGIPSWQALFLGVAPTEAGLEAFKIDSISFDGDGNVVVELPAGVTPMVGRGVNIAINLMKADTPNAAAADWTLVETAGGEDNKTFAAFAPGSTDTKKFYKVIVEFAGSSASASQE